jgi:ATP-dependent DNA helicase RecG
MVHKESETIEFKKSTAELKEAVISIVAMLNKHGRGEVYFGINDRDGRVLGMTIVRMTIKDVTQAVVDNTEPKVYPKVEARKIEGKDCIVVEAKGNSGPYFAYGRAYLRVGESNKGMSPQELEERILEKRKFLWDKEVSEKALADVNEEAVKEFMRKAKTAKRVDFELVNVKTTLHKLHLLEGSHLLRAAEVLFCDDNPLEVQAAIFAGTDKLTFLDIKSFKGNLFSLRQQAEVYVNGNMKWRADLSESRRKEIPEIPVRAISEAVGNSLCHRDYSNPKGNEVAIFKDRIEIYNPGFFPKEVNPEDFFTGHEKSILRNPLIAETMYKSKDIERWGSGIKRIHDECVAAGIKVELKRLKTGFVVVFYRPKWEEGEGIEKGGQKSRVKSRVKVIEIIVQNPSVTIPEIAAALDMSIPGIEKIIRSLKEQKRLRRIGPDKGGHWEVSGETG